MNTVDVDLVSIGGCRSIEYSIVLYMIEGYVAERWVEGWIDVVKKRLNEFREHPNELLLLCGDLENINRWWPILASVEFKEI